MHDDDGQPIRRQRHAPRRRPGDQGSPARARGGDPGHPDIAEAVGVSPAQVTGVDVYGEYMIVEAQDPSSPDHIDQYTWRDGEVQEPPTPVHFAGLQEDTEALLFPTTGLDFDDLPDFVRDAEAACSGLGRRRSRKRSRPMCRSSARRHSTAASPSASTSRGLAAAETSKSLRAAKSSRSPSTDP